MSRLLESGAAVIVLLKNDPRKASSPNRAEERVDADAQLLRRVTELNE
jgi:hypothetical protein